MSLLAEGAGLLAFSILPWAIPLSYIVALSWARGES